jgi:hypothetical protein
VSTRRLIGAGCVIVGAAGATACLLATSAGMRDVMVTDGGTCASGGPYVVAQPCSSADMRLLLVGILGGLVATGILAAGSSALGRTMSASLLAWAGLFGLLGWNFVSLALHPPAGQQGTSGWLICGVVFWLLALGGLVPFLTGLVGDLRTAGRPDPVAARMQPLVRAEFQPAGWGDGFGSAADGATGGGGLGSAGWGQASMPVPAGGPVRSDAVARNPGAGWLGFWILLVVAGAGLGAVASSALVSALR